MASPARTILIAVLIIIALLAGGLYYLNSNINGIVAGLIEREGSAATQTAVRVTGVDIRLTDAAASLSGLSVGNPEGFSGNAIELGELSVDLDARTLTDDTIVINSIDVSGARINVLQQAQRNNLQELLANLPRGADPAPEDADGSGKRLIIGKFTLAGASASVSIPELNEMREVELPTIVVRDVGRASNGATAAQIAEQLLRPVLEAAISSAATQAVKDRAAKEVNKAVGGLLNKISGKKDGE